MSAIIPILFLSGCTQQTITPGTGTTTISIKNFSFSPNSLTVANGTMITWINDDSVDHTIIADDGLFTSGTLTPGDNFTHLFIKTGTYTYHCSIHPSMTGTIQVQ